MHFSHECDASVINNARQSVDKYAALLFEALELGLEIESVFVTIFSDILNVLPASFFIFINVFLSLLRPNKSYKQGRPFSVKFCFACAAPVKFS